MPTATIAELQEQLNQMIALMDHFGIRPPRSKDERNPDYVEYGSMQHAALLGLVIIEGEELDKARRSGYTIYASPETGKNYRLEDEMAALQHYPGVDPDKARLTVLRQKVSGFESGPPKVPEDAPPLWRPSDGY